jgi:hypothetical protein
MPTAFLRPYMWDSSFDRAGDATKAAEQELKKGINFNCTGLTEPQHIQRCEAMKLEAQGFGQEAAGIRNMQYIFADVSRASDVAAVGAIGAVGYAELFKKNQSQADSLRGAANIQETAGYVSYATGAADFSMGAYAYLAQKRRLDQMQETLNGRTSGLSMTSQNRELINRLNNAAEQTKQAAYNHMMYGAGKAAVGYASMHLAKQNRKQADNLASLDTDSFYNNQGAQIHQPMPQGAGGGVPYYQNNNPQFFVPGSGATSSVAPASSSPTFTGGGGGASVMPSPEFRGLASNGAKGSGGFSGGLNSAPGPTPGSTNADEEAEAAEAAGAAAQPAGQSFEIAVGRGGGSRYGGGSGGSSDDSGGLAEVLGAVVGGGSPSASSATGLNPNALYRDALEGLDGTEHQGSMAGVNGRDRTLFQVVKSKYYKMMEVGRLQGPGAVEVRN